MTASHDYSRVPRDFSIAESHRRKLDRPAVFFRSLATMVGAGIPLLKALDLIGRSSDSEDNRAVCDQASTRIAQGWTLSAACYEFPRIFTPYMIGLIRVGEKTGSLPQVLNTIAAHLEKNEAMQLKLRSAVTYPLILSAGALLLLCVGPSFLLEGQLTMLRQSGEPLPPLTQALVVWTAICKSPLTWMLIVASGLGAVWASRVPGYQRYWAWKFYSAPGISKLTKLSSCARFARALKIALQVGLPLLEALPLCAEATGNPVLKSRIGTSHDELVEGESLRDSLEMILFFPTTFCALVEVGEEAGKLPAMLSLSADFAELELDMALAALTTLIEPVLLMVMGVFTALVLVATLQPTLSLLRTL
jgi:type II secretory pathway component PulF